MRDKELLTRLLQDNQALRIGMKDDGNCKFRAFAYAMMGDPERHAECRSEIVEHMGGNPGLYEAMVSIPWGEYLENMKEDGQFGDRETLLAAVELWAQRVIVMGHESRACLSQLSDAE